MNADNTLISIRVHRRLSAAHILSRFLKIAPALLCAVALASCARKPLPVFGSVPHFELTDQSGQPFDSSTLSGHVWVADFIYTTCPGPCPMMSSKMSRLQASTAGMPDVRLVSFTVDPEHDTPAVLAEYGKHFNAEPARWRFLTGDRARLNALGMDAFHLNHVDGSLIHSTRFALVDRHGRIRGYYASQEDGFLPKLLEDVRKLENEA
jgi:protein SCO1/2